MPPEEQSDHAVIHDPELKPFMGCKIILAKPMHEDEWRKSKDEENCERNVGRDGYLVVYAGGYRSWSPKKEFELAYREITHDEKSMIKF